MEDGARDVGGSYVKVCPVGPFVCYTRVTINHATFLSQKGPSLDGKLHERTTLRLVEVMGCQ